MWPRQVRLVVKPLHRSTTGVTLGANQHPSSPNPDAGLPALVPTPAARRDLNLDRAAYAFVRIVAAFVTKIVSINSFSNPL